jgi:PhnB protein
MTVQLNPYLTFNGNAREAMEFYHSVLGGELSVNTFGEFGNPDPAQADRIMHAMLAGDKGTLMASDAAPGTPFTPSNNSMTCSLSGGPGDGLEEVWAKLSDGGQVTLPFEKQVWGDQFGMCVDRFGVPWMVNISQQS